jgi:hypothetical protein
MGDLQDPKMEVPTIYKAYIRPMQVNITRKYCLIWYSTSILGSWRSPIEIPNDKRAARISDGNNKLHKNHIFWKRVVQPKEALRRI